MALYREIKRQVGMPVTVALWKHGDDDEVRARREAQGQTAGEYADLGLVPVGDNLEAGRRLLAVHGGEGSVHVFCVYQNSSVWRKLILEAKQGGARVVVSAEAPCEMCVGLKALAKRMYYRWILPWRVGNVARSADLFLNASGMDGVDRLVCLGWAREKIVPFGYASEVVHGTGVRIPRACVPLRVLHSGIEERYRGVDTLTKAVHKLKGRGIDVEVMRTGGCVPKEELVKLYGWADVFVACGLCEPWGMRVNDAIHAGLPVVVSEGMGAKWLVEQFNCGGIFRKGDVDGLASILERIARDDEFMERIRSGVMRAHEAWTPEARARVWIEAVLGQPMETREG